MSRTDKDTPYWVGCGWVAQHTFECRWHGRCTLPEQPPKRPPMQRYRTRTNRQVCRWIPDWDRSRYGVPRWWSHAPRWFIHHVWEDTERLAARVDCLTAVKEHRAGGEVDVVPTTRQHRHMARWLWD